VDSAGSPRHPPRMVRSYCVVMPVWLLAWALLGCQQGQHGDPAQTPYARDIDKICHAEERSGALEQPESQRGLVVAQWLGGNLESDGARTFLVRLAQADPAGKTALLEAESRALGMSGCPLAASWTAGPH